jgi:hypothetical protein
MLVSLFCGGFLAEGRLVGGSPSSVMRMMCAAGIDFLPVVDIIGRCETSFVARAAGAAEIDAKFLVGLLIVFANVLLIWCAFFVFLVTRFLFWWSGSDRWPWLLCQSSVPRNVSHVPP